MTRVILALAGLPQEPELVRAAADAGLTVVRRCVDAVDLLGAAALDADSPVIVSAVLPRISADVVTRLEGRARIGLASDALSGDRLARLGIETVLSTSPTPDATMQQVADVCRAQAAQSAARSPAGGPAKSSGPAKSTGPAKSSGPADAGVPAPSDAQPGVDPAGTPPGGGPSAGEASGRRGTVIAVWGPMGAPGRTTIALGVAEALADDGARVCLVDADTYGPSVAMALGLVEETSGLSLACRSAEAGSLSPAALASLTMTMTASQDGRWRVLGGIARVDRWADLGSAGLDRLWPVARAAFDVVVVDTGFCVESDDSPGAWGRQRNAAARSALAQADHVLAVADDSALGATRLLSAWPQVGALVPGVPTTVVRNRADGRGGQWRSLVDDRVAAHRIVDVPHDPRTLRACWSTGRSLGEAGRRSPVRRALVTLARSSVSRWIPTDQ